MQVGSFAGAPEAQQIDKGLLALAYHRHIDGRVLKNPAIIFLHLRPADNDAQFREVLFDPPDDIEAALAVPGIEGYAEHIRLMAYNCIDQQRIAGMISEVTRQ